MYYDQLCVSAVTFYRSNKNVTLVLAWNVIPNAGILPKIWGRGSHRVEFPDDYSASKF